jgi:tetratricopeptide (TPR) repeat protein
LPFALLLLDYWPLGRFRFEEGRSWRNSFDYRLLWEKIPLFVLTAASCITTFLSQRRIGNIYSSLYPLDERIANAVTSYVVYLWKTAWPFRLTFFYPHPEYVPRWQVVGGALLLIAIGLLAIAVLKRRPYCIVGYLWYLGTLVPVIGLVQVSVQAMNDRFTYVPHIGIFIIIAWGVPDLVARWRYARTGLFIAAAAVLTFMGKTAWSQVGYWKNDIALFEHALEVTSDNYIAHENLGEALINAGRIEEGIHHSREAIRIKPNYVEPYGTLGNGLIALGRFDEAIGVYSEMLNLNPSSTNRQKAHNNLGTAFLKKGRIDEAIAHFQEVLLINPRSVTAHYNIGVALTGQGKYAEAMGHYDEALRLNPEYAKAHYNKGSILAIQGSTGEAMPHFQEALRMEPGNQRFRIAYATALSDLAKTYIVREEYENAISCYTRILELDPNDYVPYYNIARLYSKNNRTEEAIAWLEKAVASGFSEWDFLKNDKFMNNIRATSYYKELMSQ